MKIIEGDYAPLSKDIYEKLQKQYPAARNFKFSIVEDSYPFFTATLEVQVGKKKLIAKKIGASANESINRAFSALKKRLEKNTGRTGQRKKFFLSIPTQYAI